MSEARTGKRFPLELPIRIRQKGASADRGTTADMSAAGVYIHANTDLPVGSHLEVDITLQAKVLGTASVVEVHCTGRVVRKEGDGRDGRGNNVKHVEGWLIDPYKFI